MSEKQQIISLADTEHVARLAHLRFDEGELAQCRDKLGAVLDYMQELHDVDTDGVPPTSHVLPLTNVFREDAVGQPLSREQVLANAPETEDGYFKVPRII